MSKGDKTRNRIIRQAAPLFNKYGLAGVSISDIMRETNLQKGGIYRHFSSKEEIALATFDYNYQRLVKRIKSGLDTQPTYRQKLTHLLENFATVPEFIEGGCQVLNTAVEHDDGNPALRDRAQKATETWQQLIVDLLEDGITEGEFRQDIDPAGIATLYIAALEGAIMLTRLHDSPSHMQRVIVGLQQYASAHIYTGVTPE